MGNSDPMFSRDGLPADQVLAELDARLSDDRSYEDGHILGTMICRPHPLGVEAFRRAITKNIGDSGLYPELIELEREAVRMIGALLSNADAVGHIVTGGSEANVISLWAALSRHGKPGRVLAPATAHFSFDKAARLTGHELMRLPVDDAGRLIVSELETTLNQTENVAAVVAIAGTTGLGAVDPITEIGALCAARDIYFHVDAAFGGFVLPFLEGHDFDFAVPAVHSMTIDPHKMGWAPMPAGGILFRDQATADLVSTPVGYLAGGATRQRTVVGTRTGGAVAATWTLLKHLGRSGYRELVHRCVGLAHEFAARVDALDGADLATQPTMNVVGIRSRNVTADILAARLRERGWSVSLFPEHIRIVVLPHVDEAALEAFLEDLEDVI